MGNHPFCVFHFKIDIRNTYVQEREKHATEAQKYDISVEETLISQLVEVYMTEISKKIIFHDMTGTACGPVNFATIDAELTIQDGTETVYIFGDWDTESCEIRCMAVRNSIFDICEKVANDKENIDLLTAERNEIESEKIADDDKYQDYYTEIKRMISKEMASHGYKPDFTD